MEKKRIGITLVLSSLALSAFSFLVLMNNLVVPEGSPPSVLGAPLLLASVIMLLAGAVIVFDSRRRTRRMKPPDMGETRGGGKLQPDAKPVIAKEEESDRRLVLVKRLVGLACFSVFLLGVLAPYNYDGVMIVIVLLGSPVALVGFPIMILSLYLIIGGRVRRRDYVLGAACVLLAATMVPNPVLYMMEGAGNEYPDLANFTSFTYRIDPGVSIHLASGVPPSAANIKTTFADGETIYPQESGLSIGTYFAFRVLDPDGLPTNATGNAIARVTGEGGMGWGTFNTPDAPLEPGKYTIEVVTIERGTAFAVATQDFEIQ